MTTLQRMNKAFRPLLKASGSLQGAPTDSIIHPDFVDAGAQRRHLVIDLGAPVREASVKFKTFDGAALSQSSTPLASISTASDSWLR